MFFLHVFPHTPTFEHSSTTSSPLLLAQLLSMFVLSMCASSDTRVFAGLRSQLCFLLVFPPTSEHSSSTSSPLLAFAHTSDFYDLSACVSSDFWAFPLCRLHLWFLCSFCVCFLRLKWIKLYLLHQIYLHHWFCFWTLFTPLLSILMFPQTVFRKETVKSPGCI